MPYFVFTVGDCEIRHPEIPSLCHHVPYFFKVVSVDSQFSGASVRLILTSETLAKRSLLKGPRWDWRSQPQNQCTPSVLRSPSVLGGEGSHSRFGPEKWMKVSTAFGLSYQTTVMTFPTWFIDPSLCLENHRTETQRQCRQQPRRTDSHPDTWLQAESASL